MFEQGGDMGARAALMDWAATPLGLPDQWPEALRVLVGVMLGSRQPMFIAWGRDRVMLYNDGYAPLLGQRHPAALGGRFETVWADILDDVGPIMDQAYAGNATHMDDIRFVMHRHGYPEETHFAFSYTPVRDEAGVVRGVFCACMETTEQVRAARLQAEAEAELKALNALLEQRMAERTADRDRLWRLSADVMLVARFDGTVMAVNPAWHSMLGWKEGELIGTSFLDLVHPEDLLATEDTAGNLAAGRAVSHFQNRYRRQDGGWCWLSWSAVPGEALIHAIGRDITAQRAAEEQLARAQEQLRQSQKMEAVGQLTGGLAHDFNNMMTGIIGSLELLQGRIERGSARDAGRFIGAAMASAQRAAALTHRLLSFSRRQTLDPKPVDVARLAASLEDLIRRTVGPTIRVEMHWPAALWPALCDPNQLENALLNLAINARDAMIEGGTLRMEAENAPLDPAAARALELPAGDYVRISVSDTGSGMDPEVARRAFEPFFTTKPMGESTGLGLSMVYGFARQSGGHAGISSRAGTGTTVRLYLPFAEKTLAPAADIAEPPAFAESRAAGARVLVVDDEPAVRMLAAEVLEDEGHAVLQAGDGAAALRLLDAGPVDLLLTDVGLPGGMNGRQLADAARQRQPGLPVLFITGYDGSAALRGGVLEDGTEVMIKPFNLNKLVQKVAAMMGAG
jgi:PAS domain S-box-containing protein